MKELKKVTEKYNWDELDFTGKIGLKEFKIFEKKNPDIGLVVRTYDLETKMITKLGLTNKMNCKRAELFLYDDHFSAIWNPSRLMSAQCRKHKEATRFHDYCDNNFSSQNALNNHMSFCKDHSFITVKYLEQDAGTENPLKLKFKNTKKMVRHPIMITAEFESLLLKVNEKHGKNTTRFQVHKASCDGMYIYRFDSKNKYFKFTSPN